MTLKDFTYNILPIKDKLYRFALRIVENGAEAEDIVQEVFIKTWNKRDQMHEIKNVEAWCMRLTKNLSIDKLRSKHKKVAQLSDGLVLKEKTANPHQKAEINDTVNHVKRLMDTLPEKQRMVIQLRDIEGMQYQEIADIMSISMEQVKVNLFRGRKQIRTKLINTQSYGI